MSDESKKMSDESKNFAKNLRSFAFEKLISYRGKTKTNIKQTLYKKQNMDDITKENHTLRYDEVRQIIEDRISIIDKSAMKSPELVEDSKQIPKSGFFARKGENFRFIIKELIIAFKNKPNKK